MAGQTPWQTTGPFFHFGVLWKGSADLAGDSDLGARPDLTAPGHDQSIVHANTGRDRVAGERIEVTGRVFDNTGAAVMDALIETWQANAFGRYAHPEDARADVTLDPYFIGFGRTALDKNGIFRLRTIRPGRVPGPGNSLQAPHVALGIMGPGFLKRLSTRIYFPDERANDEDPILALVPEARRSTLIATKEAKATYRFDIHLGGPRETVFFDI